MSAPVHKEDDCWDLYRTQIKFVKYTVITHRSFKRYSFSQSSFLTIQIKCAVVVTTFVAVYKLNLLFLCHQEDQDDLGLWEEKFGKFVDIKVNGKVEIVVLKQILPKMAKYCYLKSLSLGPNK